MNRNQHAHFGIYGYLKSDGKVLVIKKARGPYTGMYDLPGGSPAVNESNIQTLLREIKEETDLVVTDFNKLTDEVITLFYEYEVNHKPYLFRHSALFYFIKSYTGVTKACSDGEDSDGAIWIDINHINKYEVTPLVKKALELDQI